MSSLTPCSSEEGYAFSGRRESGWSSCDLDGVESDFGSDYIPSHCVNNRETTGDDVQSPLNSKDKCEFFIPDGKFDLNKLSKKDMPNLPQECLPKGIKVCVTDENDVKMQLGDAWSEHYKSVCNGRAVGSVVRHQERLTLVLFVDPNDNSYVFSFTLPRRCLSVEVFDPYNNSSDDETEMTIYVGALDPSPGHGTEKKYGVVPLAQQFFDVVDPIEPSQCTEASWALISKMKFVPAIASLNDIIADNTKNTKLYLECLAMRSFAYFFNGDVEKSLQDSLRIIEISLSCIHGYVGAARVYAYLGKIQLGIEMMNQAMLLLPHSHEIDLTIQLLSKTRQLQTSLDQHFLTYYIDSNYARRLMARRGFNEGDTIIEEEDVIIGAPSIENDGVCCDFCIGSSTATKYLPVPGMSGYGNAYAYFDSFRCQSRSQAYLPLELGRAENCFRFAYTLMQNKASSSNDILSIERARLAVRLFYTIFTKNSIPEINDATPEIIMCGMGIYPIPSYNIDNKTKEDLETLYNVITHFMLEEERALYSRELFIQLYNYVVEYALHIEGMTDQGSQSMAAAYLQMGPSSSDVNSYSDIDCKENVNRNILVPSYVRYSGYIISTIASCVSRSDSSDAVNCRVMSVPPGKVRLVATREIQVGHQLVIAALQKGHINYSADNKLDVFQKNNL